MRFFSAIIIFVFLYACNTNTETTDKGIIVEVGSSKLTQSDLESILSTGLTPEDSMIIAENYIKNWIKDALLYDLAKNNTDNKKEIDQLVENYRKSLITYQYQERLIAEKMSDETTEPEMKKYYEENKDKFKLKSTLVKGLFLKIPVDAPQINKIKEWYKSSSIKDIENIEKYSTQNAINYDYFYDRWVNWDDIMDLFPSQNRFTQDVIRQQRQIETQDSTFYYLLNVKDVLYAGDNEPYEYAKPNLKEMIINQKRSDFLKKFEDEIYQSAIEKGLVKRKKKEINTENKR